MFRRIPFMAIVLVVVLISVPIFVIWPNMQEIRTTGEAIYNEYVYLEQKSKQGQNIRRAKAEYEALQDQRGSLHTLALTPGNELRFITALEELADATGVKETLQLDVEHQKQQNGYQGLPFVLLATGTYPEVVRYIAAIHSLPLVTSFTSINMFAEQRGSSGLQLTTPAYIIQAQIAGLVYEYKQTPPTSH